MIGILDVGGGMRGVYPAGIYDYLLDNNIFFDYYIGVSAGSGNLVSYVAKQRERNLRYYRDYSFRKEYMSFGNFIKRGSYIDLHYIYADMCNTGGEDVIDFKTFMENAKEFVIVATNGLNGKVKYFSHRDLTLDHYEPLMASCCIPGVCKPIMIDGIPYFDGGVSNPIPYQKAFDDGCDKLVICLTRPLDVAHKPLSHPKLMKFLLRKYPETFRVTDEKDKLYNKQIEEIKELEKQGKVLIMAPTNTFGVDTLSHDKDAMMKFYNHGYEDAKKIIDFINK